MSAHQGFLSIWEQSILYSKLKLPGVVCVYSTDASSLAIAVFPCFLHFSASLPGIST